MSTIIFFLSTYFAHPSFIRRGANRMQPSPRILATFSLHVWGSILFFSTCRCMIRVLYEINTNKLPPGLNNKYHGVCNALCCDFLGVTQEL